MIKNPQLPATTHLSSYISTMPSFIALLYYRPFSIYIEYIYVRGTPPSSSRGKKLSMYTEEYSGGNGKYGVEYSVPRGVDIVRGFGKYDIKLRHENGYAANVQDTTE